MFYGVYVLFDHRRDPALRRKIDATLKAQRNLAYRKFKTTRAAEKELAKLPPKVRAECRVMAFESSPSWWVY